MEIKSLWSHYLWSYLSPNLNHFCICWAIAAKFEKWERSQSNYISIKFNTKSKYRQDKDSESIFVRILTRNQRKAEAQNYQTSGNPPSPPFWVSFWDFEPDMKGKKTWPAHNPDLAHSWTSKMQTSRKVNLKSHH